MEVDLEREVEIAPELEPADSVERFQKLPESEEFIDLSLNLDDEPENDPDALKVAERIQELTDGEEFNDFGLETPGSEVEGMEIGDEDLLELILVDDELVFDLDGGDQMDSFPVKKRAQVKRFRNKSSQARGHQGLCVGFMGT
jgi:hypothetical protein